MFILYNIGGGGKNASTTYSVLADGMHHRTGVLSNYLKQILLDQFLFPLDGRTCMLKCSQMQMIRAGASLSCRGRMRKGSSGFHSIGFTEMDPRANDVTRRLVLFRAPNTMGRSK
jgi:hypothetical protein